MVEKKKKHSKPKGFANSRVSPRRQTESPSRHSPQRTNSPQAGNKGDFGNINVSPNDQSLDSPSPSPSAPFRCVASASATEKATPAPTPFETLAPSPTPLKDGIPPPNGTTASVAPRRCRRGPRRHRRCPRPGGGWPRCVPARRGRFSGSRSPRTMPSRS